MRSGLTQRNSPPSTTASPGTLGAGLCVTQVWLRGRSGECIDDIRSLQCTNKSAYILGRGIVYIYLLGAGAVRFHLTSPALSLSFVFLQSSLISFYTLRNRCQARRSDSGRTALALRISTRLGSPKSTVGRSMVLDLLTPHIIRPVSTSTFQQSRF